MSQIELSNEDLELLNQKLGIRSLLGQQKINLPKAIKNTRYLLELKRLQAELIKMQYWIINNNKKLIVLFEGRDSAGKTGTIRRITEHINPRHFRVVALDKPTADERYQWYFQRYVNHLPVPGAIVFFDRSWYNRAIVEPVNDFCTNEEYERFMTQVNEFENMIVDENTFLIKFYLSVSKEEQKIRFKEIRKSAFKKWKITELDEKAQEQWDEYTSYKETMLERTSTENAPWKVVSANDKYNSRIVIIKYLLDQVPYTK
ncbi:MAG: polyphosphate kinase 2 [Saprospiraceae bacterium]|jgi:polyphosphate kinase 2